MQTQIGSDSLLHAQILLTLYISESMHHALVYISDPAVEELKISTTLVTLKERLNVYENTEWLINPNDLVILQE